MTNASETRRLQRQRHEALLRACVRSESGEITYQDVQTLYFRWYVEADASTFDYQQRPEVHALVRDDAARHTHFRDDCKSLAKSFEEMTTSYLSPFFLPVPRVEFVNTKGNKTKNVQKVEKLIVHSGRRPAAKQKNTHSDRISARRALSKFIADQKSVWPKTNDPLFPMKGKLFAANGTTVCFLIYEILCEMNLSLADLTIFTSSFDISALLYYIHQNAGARSGIRIGETLKVDREVGAIYPVEGSSIEKVDTAIVSCHGIYKGEFYSSSPTALNTYTTKFLEKAERILIVIDEYKVGRIDGEKVNYLNLAAKNVLIVSDAKEADLKDHLPPGMPYLLSRSAATSTTET